MSEKTVEFIDSNHTKYWTTNTAKNTANDEKSTSINDSTT